MNGITLRMSGNNDKISIGLLVLHRDVCLLDIQGHVGNLHQKITKLLEGVGIRDVKSREM